ncbi:MAG: GTPase HflX [Firmicutes bacterium]|nr:GTPase HflX [Candidatus Fermentithermobacillaceae bacterium]
MPKTPFELSENTTFKAVLVGIHDHKAVVASKDQMFSWKESMRELARLAETLDFEVVAQVTQEREAPDPQTYVGKGKARELVETVESEDAACVVVDGRLSPTQLRNLEDLTGVEVMDRTDLILRIFASRAKTAEGKIQVQMAAAQHALARLTGAGIEMSNPGAGIGTRGPGETKIEMDRRALRNRIASLKRELKRVARHRAEQTKKRKATGIPLISLVGYTNAGKSTLFNALTGDEAYADDKLFATLDPWTRRWQLSGGQVVLLVDTVGFIQGLPHELIAAFRATLEESVDSDLLIHVVDASNSAWPQQMATVHGVLSDLGVDERPRVVCFNKKDRVSPQELESMLRIHSGAVAISAVFEEGLDELTRRVVEGLSKKRITVSWHVPYSKWDLVFDIKRVGNIRSEIHDDEGALLRVDLLPEDAERLSRKLGIKKK